MQTALSSESQPKVVNRWLVIFGTALVQLGVGTFYAWSIFNTPILKMFHQLVLDPATGKPAAVQPHLGSISLIFSIGALALSLSTIFVGSLVKKFGVRKSRSQPVSYLVFQSLSHHALVLQINCGYTICQQVLC